MSLIEAVTAGNVETVRKWLSRTRQNHHEQLLMMKQVLTTAAKLGRTNICQIMLDSGKISNEASTFALILACENNRLFTAKLLLKRSFITTNSLSEMRSRACLNGHTRIVEWLTRDIMNLSPANVARWKFISACARGDVSVVENLVKRVVTDVKGTMSQALRIACYTCNSKVVKWLTEKARVDVNDSFSELDDELNFFMRTRRRDNRELSRPQPVSFATNVMLSGYYRRETALHVVIGTEISSDARLHAACFNGNIYLASQLVYECDVNLQLTDGCTPLHYACIRGNKEVVQMLLSVFAKTDVTDDNKHTPGMIAAIHEKSELSSLIQLFGHGAFDKKPATHSAPAVCAQKASDKKLATPRAPAPYANGAYNKKLATRSVPAEYAYGHGGLDKKLATQNLPNYEKLAIPVSMVNDCEFTHADLLSDLCRGSNTKIRTTECIQLFKLSNKPNASKPPRSRYDYCCIS